MEKVKRVSAKCFFVLMFVFLMCFGMGISAQAVGDGGYIVAPPSGSSVSDVFRTVGTTKIDSKYQNTAIVTLDTQNQFGALWSKEQLDLTKSFSAEMYLYLGHASGKSGTLADGMTFTMHNNSTALNQMIGGRGEGLGVYRGRRSTGGTGTVVDGSYLPNSLVVEFDTYRNILDGWSYVGDPSTGTTGHCSLVIPRTNSINSSGHNNTFGFTPAQKWVKFEVSWTPSGSKGGTLTYSFNGTSKQYTISDVTSVFGGTKVYWGFTGATGMYSSVQAVAITKLPVLPVTEKSAPPVINTVMEYDEEIAGTGVPGAAITATLPNGNTVNATVNSGGAWTVNVPNGVVLEVGDVISAVQQETGKLVSDAANTTVAAYPTVEPGIDIFVENLTTGEDYAKAGDLLMYDAIISNNGTSTWTSAYVTFYLNEYSTLQVSSIRINNRTVTSSQYAYDSTANTLTLYLGDIESGSGVSISFRTTVSADIPNIDDCVLNTALGSLITRSLIYSW